MTPVSISSHTAEGLKSGKLSLDGFDRTCASCGGVLVINDSITWEHRDAGCCVFPDPIRRHLVPIIGSPPTCETCGGSGTVLYNDGFGPQSCRCVHCAGSGYPKDITLVVECDAPSCYQGELRYRTGVDDYESEPCGKCGSTGYRPVATAQLLQVLPMWDRCTGDLEAPPHVCRSTSGLLMHYPESSPSADGETEHVIHHLLPWFGEGVKWAGLVTGLEAGSST